jgi:hypothetical protein
MSGQLSIATPVESKDNFFSREGRRSDANDGAFLMHPVTRDGYRDGIDAFGPAAKLSNNEIFRKGCDPNAIDTSSLGYGPVVWDGA